MTAFEAQYLHGRDSESLAKLRLHQALRSPELKERLEPARVAPARRPFLLSWRVAAVAASLAALVFATLYGIESHRLAGLLAAANSKRIIVPGHAEQEPPVEQPAGLTPSGGLVLPPSSGELTLRVGKPPSSLTWTSVPDYRDQYRIRIDASSGQEISSGPLTPKDNAVEYAPADPAALTLPWDVFVLAPAGKAERVLAHYILKP
jgi:hypothetical protein